jgi:hypothetical protein
MTKKELTFKMALLMAKMGKKVEYSENELENATDETYRSFLNYKIISLHGQIQGVKEVALFLNLDIENKLMPLCRGLMVKYELDELEKLKENPFENI